MSDRLQFDEIMQRFIPVQGRRVVLDRDLADLFGVSLPRLRQAVSKNLARFPSHSLLRLAAGEAPASESAYGFTEEGVAMLAFVLRTKRAVQLSVDIVRGVCHWAELN